MATHSSILACRIPHIEEPGRLQSVGSQRVRHDCSNLARTPQPCIRVNLHFPIRPTPFSAPQSPCVCLFISALQVRASLPFF